MEDDVGQRLLHHLQRLLGDVRCDLGRFAGDHQVGVQVVDRPHPGQLESDRIVERVLLEQGRDQAEDGPAGLGERRAGGVAGRVEVRGLDGPVVACVEVHQDRAEGTGHRVVHVADDTLALVGDGQVARPIL